MVCGNKLSNEDVVANVTTVLGTNAEDWYHGKAVLTTPHMNALTLSQLISYWKSRSIDNFTVQTIQSAIDNKQMIDISSMRFDAIDVQVVHPITDGRPRVLINTDPYIRETFKAHRSGWKHVLKGLATFERPHRRGLLFDSCVDRTFLWGKSVLNHENIIPYTRPWVGVIHHTFSEHCGPNNCSILFQTTEFVESLDYCKGLIVMSDYLAKQIRESLPPLYSHIPVDVVKHPTEYVGAEKCFNPSLFDGTLTHIGDFLRNKQAFADLRVNTWKKQRLNNVQSDGGLSSSQWGLECVTFNEECVIGRLDDDEYDILLTKTVVFLNLYDASACNTLIECIARKTPIIVNRHPAVVEYIGADYPGLYSSLDEVPGMCTAYNMQKMYDYLHATNMNKDISIKSFLRGIECILFKNIYNKL
jgi:hypothetical protein